MTDFKNLAIDECLEARKLAICRKTRVGAAIYGADCISTGYNIENRCAKGVHAEELAIFNL